MDVIGFPNYLIYPDGRVWSKTRFTKFDGNVCEKYGYRKGHLRKQEGRWMKYGRDKDGYLTVGLREGGKTFTKKIHRLIAIHYIPNPENKPTVDHINRIKTDNRIENLRWATTKEQNNNMDRSNAFLKKGHNNEMRIYKTNTGHRNVSVHREGFQYTKKSKGKVIAYYFSKDKKMCLCYKFITQLKIRAGLL